VRAAIGAAIILIAVPALAGRTQSRPRLAAPPSPPPVTYDVWGFRWDGHQYVKPTTYSYSTTDLQKGAGLRSRDHRLRRLVGNDEPAGSLRRPHLLPRSGHQQRAPRSISR